MMWQKLMMAEAAPSGYSCNITIGNSSGFYGYDIGALVGTIGSIDAEPIPGETLIAVIWNTTNQLAIYFSGDIVSLLTGLNLYINSVNYGGSGSWALDGPDTFFVSSSPIPSLTSGTYLLEIK